MQAGADGCRCALRALAEENRLRRGGSEEAKAEEYFIKAGFFRRSRALLEPCFGLVAATSCQESGAMGARDLVGALTTGFPHHQASYCARTTRLGTQR